MRETLGRASTQYSDFLGTVALDRPDREEKLYELAGISPGEWFIVGYEIGGSYATTGAYVWAVPRNDQAKYDSWEARASEELETIPASRFAFDAENPEAALGLLAMHKRWNIRALYRSFVKLDLDLERDDDD